jgi:ribosomal-protein-alanine N-acetyltransferase
LKEIYELRSSDLINQHLDRPKANSIDDAIQFIQKIRAGVSSNDLYYWVIINKSTKEFLGTIGIFNFSDDRKSAELGYELLPQFHGKGIMQEVIPRIIRFCFDELHLREIEAELSKHNLKSIALLVNNGFHLEKNINDVVVKYVLARKHSQD